MVRIGLVGPAKSGKSLAAKFFQEQYGGTINAFANAMKVELVGFLQQYRLNNYSPAWLAQHKDLKKLISMLTYCSLPPLGSKVNGFSAIDWVNTHKDEIRPIMQYYGTEYRRAQDDEYWLKKLEPTFEHENVFIDDCRFVNEAEFLVEKHGCFLIGIKPIDLDPNTDAKHSSELGVQEIIEKYQIPVVNNDKENLSKFKHDLLEAVKPYLV